MITHILDIPVSKLTQDYVRIENLKQYLIEVEQINPADLGRYVPYWRDLKQNIVEGVWGAESSGYRYMPGDLFFYGNFGTIQRTNAAKITEPIRPLVTDREWELSYGLLVASGFSGWSGDEQFTSDKLIHDYIKFGIPDKVHDEMKIRHLMLFNSRGELKEYIDPLAYLKQTHKYKKGKPLYYNEACNFSILGCLEKSTLVRTFEGPSIMVQDLKVGDKLRGIDDEPRIVQDVFKGTSAMVKVESRYSEPFICTTAHILRLRKRVVKNNHNPSKRYKTIKYKDLSVGEFMELPASKQKLYELCESNENTPIEYPKKDLKYDPYFLGLWLGDGFKREKMIVVSPSDPEIKEWLVNHAISKNITYSIKESTGGLGTQRLERITLHFQEGENTKSSWFAKNIKNNKYIPDEYKYSSIEDRLKLIAGYIDSDGNYDGKRYTITSTDLSLLKDAQEVCRSLGFRAKIHGPNISGITDSLKYNLRITGNITSIPVLVNRKKAKENCNFFKRGSNLNCINVALVGPGEFVGFEVDKDNLYLLDDYTVDHNSRGGGKSYFASVGKGLHAIVTDGAKYYNNLDGKYYKDPLYREEQEQPIVEIMVGSGNSDKSSEFANKMQFAMNQFSTNSSFGVWGKEGDQDYTPSPFFKQMVGSIGPNNKENPWRHEYSVMDRGKEIKKGSKSKLYHVSYFEGKAQGKGSQAGAGGRVLYSFTEESGLCFGENTEVRMYDGTVKMVQDLKEGDLVMGNDGTPRTISNPYTGIDELYEVSQLYGNTYTVNSNHPLCLKFKSWKKGISSTEKVLVPACKFNTIKNRKTHYGYKNDLLIFPTQQVELDPYYLGYWIGDGTTNSGDITTMDLEVKNYMGVYARSLDLKLKVQGQSGKSTMYSLSRDKKDSGGKLNKIRQGLKKYGIFNKKDIPIEFIHNDEQTRLNLLAGLLDSDGCYINSKTAHYFEFYQTNRKELVDKVMYLALTLGFQAKIRTKVTNKGFNNKTLDTYRTKYILRISGDIERIPTKVKRKQAVKRTYLKDMSSTSIKVISIGKGLYYGFSLKEDPYFLLSDGTIAHNTGNTIEIHNSNKFVVSRDGIQFGVQVDLGTSGNIVAVQQTKKKFMNPFDYDILPYKDPEELGQNGCIGFFLPFYLTLNYCKDEDGNTIYEKAFAETLQRREKAALSTDPSVLREEKMNGPILPSEMWISKQGYYLPYDEAVLRQKNLSKNGLFRDLGTPIRLTWDSTKPYGVDAKPEEELIPYYHFPIESDRTTKEAPPIIYEHPIFIHGEIPQGMYFSVYDPYVSDNLEDGGSLGCTFILLDPLYWDDYLTDKGPIVATYIAKHAEGLDGYHEVQEKLLAYYGNQDNAHYYEKNRGRSCRDYYIKKGKACLLGLEPKTYDSSSSVAKRVLEYGISVPNGPKKIQMLDETSDWLKSEVITKNGDIKRLMELISCKFTVDQIVDFDLERANNFDAVSTLILVPTAIKERQFYFTEKVTGKNKSNVLSFLTSNERLWSH